MWQEGTPQDPPCLLCVSRHVPAPLWETLAFSTEHKQKLLRAQASGQRPIPFQTPSLPCCPTPIFWGQEMREFELPMSLGLPRLALDTGHPEDAGGLPGLAVWFWTGCVSGQSPPVQAPAHRPWTPIAATGQ